MANPISKFTFKRQPKATGLARVADPTPAVDIKLKGKNVGWLQPPRWRDEETQWKLFLRVKSDEHPGWRNAALKVRFENEADARAFVTQNNRMLQEKFDLVPLD